MKLFKNNMINCLQDPGTCGHSYTEYDSDYGMYYACDKCSFLRQLVGMDMCPYKDRCEQKKTKC